MAQLKSTNVTGNLSVTGNILASKLIKIGGTANQILMANGDTTNLSDILGKLNAAVILKGTLGTDGTIQSLPTASVAVLGHAYKVVTKGTYNGVTAKVGDMFICYESSANTYTWMLIPSGDDIENTWRPIKLEGTQILTNGTSSKPLNFKQGANITITHSDGDLTIAATDMTYSLPLATSTVRGGLKVGYTSTQDNLALTLSTATASAEQAYVSLPSRLYAGNTTATTNPTHSGYYFYKDESDAGKVFNDTAGSRQAATWVSAYDGSWAAQIGVGYYKDVIAYRRKQGSTTWGSWIELATREWVESLGYIDDVSGYLPLSGSSTTDGSKNMTGPIVFKDVNGIILNSNNKDVKVWSVWGNSGNYAEQYGFHLLYKGTGSGNDNTLHLYAHNETGTKKEVYEIKQNGTTTWKTAIDFTGGITVNSINVSLEGHGHTNMVTGGGLTANNIVVGNGNSAVKISTASVNASGIVIANGFGDGTITVKPQANNEVNFGGTDTSTTIYFGHQSADSRPKPTHYQFGGTAGDATVRAKGFIKTGSDDTYVLLAGGGHKALSDFTTGGGAIGDYVTLTTPQTISGAKTFSAQPVISTADGLKFTNGNCNLRIYNTSASPTDYSAIEVRSNAATTNRNLFIDLANNSLVVGTPSGTADTTYKVKIVGTLGVTGQLTSTVATGTAPLVISSTTKVTNLNTDKVDGCDVVTSTATFPTDSDVTVPTSKAVASYVSAQKTSGVYWADQSIATSSSINTEPTFKSVTFSDGTTTKKASWTYSSDSDCVELVWM